MLYNKSQQNQTNMRCVLSEFLSSVHDTFHVLRSHDQKISIPHCLFIIVTHNIWPSSCPICLSKLNSQVHSKRVLLLFTSHRVTTVCPTAQLRPGQLTGRMWRQMLLSRLAPRSSHAQNIFGNKIFLEPSDNLNRPSNIDQSRWWKSI